MLLYSDKKVELILPICTVPQLRAFATWLKGQGKSCSPTSGFVVFNRSVRRSVSAAPVFVSRGFRDGGSQFVCSLDEF